MSGAAETLQWVVDMEKLIDRLEARLTKLEQRIDELEKQMAQQNHFHYHHYHYHQLTQPNPYPYIPPTPYIVYSTQPYPVAGSSVQYKEMK